MDNGVQFVMIHSIFMMDGCFVDNLATLMVSEKRHVHAPSRTMIIHNCYNFRFC